MKVNLKKGAAIGITAMKKGRVDYTTPTFRPVMKLTTSSRIMSKLTAFRLSSSLC